MMWVCHRRALYCLNPMPRLTNVGRHWAVMWLGHTTTIWGLWARKRKSLPLQCNRGPYNICWEASAIFGFWGWNMRFSIHSTALVTTRMMCSAAVSLHVRLWQVILSQGSSPRMRAAVATRWPTP